MRMLLTIPLILLSGGVPEFHQDDLDWAALAVAAELARAGDAGQSFREFALGLNPLLAIPDQGTPGIPYYGYGSAAAALMMTHALSRTAVALRLGQALLAAVPASPAP